MKKTPQNIKDKLFKCAVLFRRAHRMMSEVENWLFGVGIDSERLRSGSGTGLDEIERGQLPEELLFECIDELLNENDNYNN